METPVKERLVGAVILVLLLALLVPELLSGPQHSKPADSADGQTAPLRTYTIDLNGAPKPTAAPVPAAPAAARPAPAISTPPASAPEAESESTSLPSESAAVKSEAPKPEPIKPASASPLPTPTTTAAPKPAAAGSGWTVQLGSFSKSENAERLVKELKAKHYQAFVSRTGTGAKTRYRVRVGPEEDRAQAQQLAERLKREGQQVSIIPQP